MKKLLFVALIALASCTVSYEDSKVTNPEKTTIEMQNSIVDSCATLSYVDGKVYVMEDGIATYEFVATDDDYTLVSDTWLFFCSFILVLGLIAIISIISD